MHYSLQPFTPLHQLPPFVLHLQSLRHFFSLFIINALVLIFFFFSRFLPVSHQLQFLFICHWFLMSPITFTPHSNLRLKPQVKRPNSMFLLAFSGILQWSLQHTVPNYEISKFFSVWSPVHHRGRSWFLSRSFPGLFSSNSFCTGAGLLTSTTWLRTWVIGLLKATSSTSA